MGHLLPSAIGRWSLVLLLIGGMNAAVWAEGQGKKDKGLKRVQDDIYHPLQLNLDETGDAYIRFLLWTQLWGVADQNEEGSTQFSPSVRRARMMAYAQVSDRFLIVTHFGLNNLGPDNLSPTGTANASQMFLHDAWGEYKVFDNNQYSFYLGGGLHYWNGLSRLSNASTITFLTLDAQKPFFMWPSLGNSDQFGRHIGLYAKGKLGKFHYRISTNEAMENSFDATGMDMLDGSGAYATKYLSNGNLGRKVYQGYFTYQFLDQESDKLPFLAGTYLGAKTVFNIGAGFFYHKDGLISTKEGMEPKSFEELRKLSTSELKAQTELTSIQHFSADVFYDAPVGEGALTAYAAYYHYDYGDQYQGKWTSTGSVYYTQWGYLLPRFSDHGRLQPYVGYSQNDFKVADQNGHQLNIGANWLILSHHAKLSLEYLNDFNNLLPGATTQQIRFQAQIAL
ncbi:porin [Persicobacter diffluens]|uniref:Porin n=1 Tax=Persicobacter diffluens TaxID=981 RepID=A0AAN4W131_9BACT|nr:hypothetical protein PEDI_42780 [Persicobacter diffluens]